MIKIKWLMADAITYSLDTLTFFGDKILMAAISLKEKYAYNSEISQEIVVFDSESIKNIENINNNNDQWIAINKVTLQVEHLDQSIPPEYLK